MVAVSELGLQIFKGCGCCFRVRVTDIYTGGLVSLDFSFYEPFFFVIFFHNEIDEICQKVRICIALL